MLVTPRAVPAAWFVVGWLIRLALVGALVCGR
jgi:hypothetical protein